MPVQTVSFNITAKPGPMTLFVNNKGFTIKSSGPVWVASKQITFTGCDINVDIEFNGIQGQAYDMVMTINQVDQEIKGNLAQDGINSLSPTFSLTKFNVACT